MITQAAQNAEFAPTPDHQVVATVPRVNIHALCDNQQTVQAMQSAAADRRMQRAHVTIQLGGIAAAVQVYQSQPTPNVLIVESHSQRDMLLAELAQLAQVCAPNTKVIVIGHLNDVVLYRELIRQGVSEYLVAPLHQLQIIEAVAALYRDPKAEPLGKITAFVGAKGGVGSSTLAHNYGSYVSKNMAIDTVITDLDLAFGTAGLNFNQETSQGIIDALGQPDRVDQTLLDRLLTKCGDKLSLLASSGTIDREVNIEAHAVETILEIVRHNVPNVVVDVPNMWAPWIKYTLIQADDVVLTATPELASLRNAKNLIDLLKQARPNDHAPRLILNQVGVPKRPEIPVAEFAKALGVEPTVVIPYDPQVFGTAASNGQMLADVAPKSKAAEAIATLAKSLSGQDMAAKPAKSGLGGVLGKMLRKK
ncbi:MAG: CtpF protein [Hyphomicrobiales bacterium]